MLYTLLSDRNFQIAMRLSLDGSEFLSVVANGAFKINGTT